MVDSNLFCDKIVCCVYSLESPYRGESNEYTQHTIIIFEDRKDLPKLSKLDCIHLMTGENDLTQLAFYVNLHRAVIGPSATLTGQWRPDIDLRRMLTGETHKNMYPRKADN